jgi:hypothetical protein
MIIDIHTHAWPEKVSLKAQESLEFFFKVKLVGNPTVDTLLAFAGKNKIDISVICAVASRPEQVSSINKWLFSINNPAIKAFACLHPDYQDWKQELEKVKKHAHGIKFQPEFQNFYVDDEKVFPIYEEIQRLNLPVLFHCGEELSGTMLVRSSPERILKVKKQFPQLTLIAGHFGGFRLWDEVKTYLLGTDIYLDTSFFFGFLPEQEVKAMLLKHPQDRLLFGSDFPLIDQAKDIDYIRRLDIPAGVKEKILYKNAAKILGIS